VNHPSLANQTPGFCQTVKPAIDFAVRFYAFGNKESLRTSFFGSGPVVLKLIEVNLNLNMLFAGRFKLIFSFLTGRRVGI
jgi:hypothetical protein